MNTCGFEVVVVWTCADESVGGVLCLNLCVHVYLKVFADEGGAFVCSVRGLSTSIWDGFSEKPS